jgi:hypothetical protein
MVLSCLDDSDAVGPNPRLPDGASLSQQSGTCMLRPRASVAPGTLVFSLLDPDTVTICGVKLTMNAIWPTQPDSAVVWWRQTWFMTVNQDSFWVTSGGIHHPAPNGQYPIEIAFDYPVRDVDFVWQFSPQPGHTITVYDKYDSVLAVHDFGSNTSPSQYSQGFGLPNHVQGNHTFNVTGIRKVRIAAGPLGTPYVNSKTYVQMWFEPDTTCPPTGDANLDSASVRDAIFGILDSTLNDPNRIERAIEVYRFDNPAFPPPNFYVKHSPMSVGGVTATECSAPIALTITANYTALFTAHSHGLFPPATFTTCPRYPNPSQVTPAIGPSGCAPGQTDCDFHVANTTGLPVYVIDEAFLFRIMPNAAKQTTGSYDKIWVLDRLRRCFIS